MKKFLKTVKFLLFAFALSSVCMTFNPGEPEKPESSDNSNGTNSTGHDYEPIGISLSGTRPR